MTAVSGNAVKAPMKDVRGTVIPDDAKLVNVFQEYMPVTHSYKIIEVYEHVDPDRPLAWQRYEKQTIISAEMMADMKITYKNNETFPAVNTGGVVGGGYSNWRTHSTRNDQYYPYVSDPSKMTKIADDFKKKFRSLEQNDSEASKSDASAEDRSMEDKLHDGLAGQDCLKQCIARLFDIPASLVPDFANNGPWEEWEDRMNEWFQQYNLTAEFIYADEASLPRRNRFIAVWETKAGTNHAIISEWDELYQSFQKVYDPQHILYTDLINIIGWISISIDDHESFF
jgi:hypothetical protein